MPSLNRELNGDFLEALCREGAKKEDFVPLVLDLTSDDGMEDYGITSAIIGLPRTAFPCIISQLKRERGKKM